MKRKDARRLSRRQFLGATWGGVALGGVARLGFGAPAQAGSDLAALRAAIANPPASARPMTRWWWFGGAVTPEEITRELTFMKEAGLRGAEIQPVYPLAVDDAARGIRNLRYFTDEWVAVLRHAVREARRLSLQLDFTLGSGWPYGGPFVPTALSARRLRVLSQDVAGPRDVVWDVTPQLTGDDRIAAVVLAPLGAEAGLDLGRARVLRDQPTSELTQGIRRGSIVRASVEPGTFRLMLFLDSPTGQQVKRPTLGMEGPVLDHHSREAMTLFLRAGGDRVMDALREQGGTGAAPFHSVFCDSLEVYGADWTADFLGEFERRRGYDLRPLLPALFHEAGEQTPHVRHDAHLTLSELNLEYFFAPLVAWAEKRGMKARVQAHGAPGDVMQAYGLAHIPEGENIFLGDRYQVNLRHRRLASSAAHLYGKPLASSETYTWLRTPLFTTTLEMMKPATDAVLLDGLNHIVNHGYSYSPPVAGEPGWSFYASTEANHTSPWWRHYPHLARYVARACALLQRGEAVNPVAVYLPIADLYARFGAGGQHIDVEAEGLIDAGLFSGLRQGGYDFDLVHDHALAALGRVEGGVLRAGTGRYTVVIVPDVRFMPAESAERLLELVRSGGHVIAVGRVPEGPAGLQDLEARGARVRRAVEALFGPAPEAGRRRSVGAGTATLAADLDAAFAELRAVLPPDFEIREPSGPARAAAMREVGFAHRRDGAVDYYFVANVSPGTHDLRIAFAVGHRAPERLDPETGAASTSLVFEYAAQGGRKVTEVQLHLDPFESCFVAFGRDARPPLLSAASPWPEAIEASRKGSRTLVSSLVEANGTRVLRLGDGRSRRVEVDGVPATVEIGGPWTLTLGGAAPVPLAPLRSWTDLPEGRTYSGWATYDTEFDMPTTSPDVTWWIDLGTVHETAEAHLNGVALGAAWKGRRWLPCGESLRAGRNRLRVEVANLWITAMASRPPVDYSALEETYGVRWGRYGEVKPERMPPAGLLGPVRLVPRKRLSLSI